MFVKLFKYSIRDVARSKWLLLYGIFFLLLTEFLIWFSSDTSRAVVSLLNVIIIIIPLVSIIFGTIYTYNSREFVELLLSQPISRKSLYHSIYLGLTIPLVIAYLIGIGVPLIIQTDIDISILLIILVSGIALTFIFVGIAFTMALSFDDKVKGMGFAFIIWLSLSLIYDASILLLIWLLGDYPLESALIIVSSANPIDLSRIMVMLKFDVAALMGYTGAIFQRFFGGLTGIIYSIVVLLIWMVALYLIGRIKFNKKNF